MREQQISSAASRIANNIVRESQLSDTSTEGVTGEECSSTAALGQSGACSERVGNTCCCKRGLRKGTGASCYGRACSFLQADNGGFEARETISQVRLERRKPTTVNNMR